MRTPFVSLLAALVVAVPATVRAQVAAGGVPELTGARTLGLSAGVGLVTANDGIFLNPATLAARKRYSVEGSYFVERRGSENASRFIGGSVVDSQSSAVSVGVAYTNAPAGDWTGNLTHLALALPLAQQLYVGATGKWLKMDGPDPDAAGPLSSPSANAITLDAGLFWQVARYVSIGAAGYNLVSVNHDAIAPKGAGVGLTLGSETSFQVTGDWRADFDRDPQGGTKNRYGFGAEYLLARHVPIRAGWSQDELLDTSFWSAGIGLVRGNVAADLGFRQSLDESSAREIAVSLRFFLFD